VGCALEQNRLETSEAAGNLVHSKFSLVTICTRKMKHYFHNTSILLLPDNFSLGGTVTFFHSSDPSQQSQIPSFTRPELIHCSKIKPQIDKY
jgi:hypothetical protein